MQAAVREVEKKYLKLDEPVLNNVSPLSRRSLTSSAESETSTRPNSRIFPSTSLRKRSRKPPSTLRHARSTAIGGNRSPDQESSRRTWERMTINYSTPSTTSTWSMRKELTTSPSSSPSRKTTSSRIRNSPRSFTSRTAHPSSPSPL